MRRWSGLLVGNASQRKFGCLWRVQCDSPGSGCWTRHFHPPFRQKQRASHRPMSTSFSLFTIMLRGVNTIPPNTEKWLRKLLHENNGYGITSMRTSVRRTTASSQTTIGTTRTTCSSPSTTPMTTVTQCTCTSTDAWRTCTETARASLFHSLVIHRTPHGSSSERIHSHPRSYS